MSRRATIHELAEALSVLCDSDTLADLMDATLSADADERLTDYQADLAEALFESLCELRPECVILAQTREHAKPKRSLMDRFVDWATGW